MHQPTTLHVKVVSAFNMPKKVSFRDITDPYIMIQVGAQKDRTSTKIDAGSEAQFDETLTFAYNGEPALYIHLYDAEKKKDQLLGSTELELTRAVLREGFRGVVEVSDKKKKQGDILIHVTAC
eukprot:Protomagalhaensia_wolfi_Nauph_80__719@NODE_140_length_3464_cov_514_481752_g104_i0_p4_GENE_NODE_140_length_3464_cov_514_481752_g104_i0NODE_140_length_3464_cov_514_481752_g104_i0_p4_ORF_typecomplete_len123_score19_29C2/PF00168_30/9_3e14DUF4497/PF14924_6/0_069_NODE_140_length_3464_cov_514_481752_g104_i026212989